MATGSPNLGAGQMDLGKRLAWTFFLLCCYRIGVHVPIPGVDAAAIASLKACQGPFLGSLTCFQAVV